MAALQVDFPIPNTALVAGTAKTIIQIKAAANQRVKVLAYGLFTDGVTSNAVPVTFSFVRQTAAGTGTAITGVTDETEITETVQTTALGTMTVEPAGTASTMRTPKIPAFMGQYEIPLPQGQEIIIGGGTYWDIVCTAPAAVNISGYVRIEE